MAESLRKRFERSPIAEQSAEFLGTIQAWTGIHGAIVDPHAPRDPTRVRRANILARRLAVMEAVFTATSDGLAAVERIAESDDPHVAGLAAAVAARAGSAIGVARLTELSSRADFLGFQAGVALRDLRATGPTAEGPALDPED